MSDQPGDMPQGQPPAGSAPVTAGSLLRQARLAKGLHIAALATSIKVAPRKLELLEADRFDELPGATFTRALAQTVCRSLKIDPTPVLALLPQPADQVLTHMSLGLNEPFRDKPGRRVPSDLAFLKSPIVLAAAALVLASVVLYLLPAGWIGDITQAAGRNAEPPAPPVTSAPAAADVPVVPQPASAASGDGLASPAPAPAASTVSMVGEVPPAAVLASLPGSSPSSTSTPAVTAGALLLRASAQSWVEVIDGRGNALMSRHLQTGETVGLDGPTPLRVRIGNAAATRVSFRGRPVELSPTRDNVAKLELR